MSLVVEWTLQTSVLGKTTDLLLLSEGGGHDPVEIAVPRYTFDVFGPLH